MMGKNELLRQIPKIDEVLQNGQLVFLMESTPRAVVVDSVRETMEELRKEILSGEVTGELSKEDLMAEIAGRIGEKKKRSLRRVVNATGVVLHTNLGRANLTKAAVEAVCEVAGTYSTLEYDVKRGMRGSRHDHVEKLITKITGAEAAMVVNNNAAATMLCLSVMGYGREVIVSRGELVEIGGSFRVPEIMEQSGCHLREVGTTNKTKPQDYKNAFDPEKTGALMKVHTSNYKILGFTQEVTLPEMVGLGKELGLPVIYDMGNGLMVDLSANGVDEPSVIDAVKSGVDVVLFSGDKLLGGPQGGILAGKKEWIDRMKRHPLARVLRVDKMTLAAMEATFFEYQDLEAAKRRIPTLQMITRPEEELKEDAKELCALLAETVPSAEFSVEAVGDQVGGGSAPTAVLPGFAVSAALMGIDVEAAERLLRKAPTPVVARVSHNKLYVHVRTVRREEFPLVADAFRLIGARAEKG